MRSTHYRLSISLAALLLFSAPALCAVSFPSEDIVVLDTKAIAALTDEQLLENYIDILSEIEAVRAFHATSGFSMKEYTKYKEIVKYRLGMLFEINRRKLEIPPAIN
ncbi:MAG: hypothetical protein HQL20_07035 [Candidatus Omnitrophica bacterium]|nr:hypothetical protein [Candidatus Omnitrophota bacterium]